MGGRWGIFCLPLPSLTTFSQAYQCYDMRVVSVTGDNFAGVPSSGAAKARSWSPPQWRPSHHQRGVRTDIRFLILYILSFRCLIRKDLVVIGVNRLSRHGSQNQSENLVLLSC